MKRLLKANFFKNRKKQMNLEKLYAKKAELMPKLLAAGVEMVSVDEYKDGVTAREYEDNTDIIIFNDADGRQMQVDPQLLREVESLLEMVADYSKAGGGIIWDLSDDSLKHTTYQVVYDQPTGWPQPEEDKPIAPTPVG
jgi:hypothetical protein